MSASFFPLFLGAALLVHPAQAPTPAAPMSELVQFNGKWSGPFVIGKAEMKLDLSCVSFGDHWWEANYLYSSPQGKLEQRVLIGPSDDGKGYRVWSFGKDAKIPEEMTAELAGGTLTVKKTAGAPLLFTFTIDAEKRLILKVLLPGDPPKEMGKATLARLKD